MRKLLTQTEVCELLRIHYSTLCRMMNSNNFVPPVNGRGKKLLFDPDAVESWIKARSPPVTPTATTSTQRRKEKKSFEQRQAAATAALQRHVANR